MTHWWWTPTRPAPCACSSGPAWCPASATRSTPPAGRAARPGRPSAAATMGRGHDRPAPDPDGDPAPDAAWPRRCSGWAASSGLAAVGIAGAGAFATDPRRHCDARRRAGLHGGMQFTYRNPDRSTDPARVGRRRPLPGGGGLGLPPTGPRPAPGPAGRPSARRRRPVRPARPLRAAARRPRPHRRPAGGRGLAGPCRRRRQRPGRPGGGPARRPRLVRTQLAPPPARSRVVVRPRLRRDRRSARADASRRTLGSGGGVRDVPSVHRRLPDGGPRGRRRRGRRAVPGLAGAGAGPLSAGVPVRPRWPHLRVRRLPGGLPGQPGVRPPPAPGLPRARLGGGGRPARPADHGRRRAAGPQRAVVPGRTRSPLPAPQRTRRPRQRRRRARPGHGGRARPVDAVRGRPSWPSTPGGPPDGSAGRTWSRGRSRPVHRRDPPAGHQRLPAQGGGDPGVPVGAVAAARPVDISPC